MTKDEFMELVYETFDGEPDNVLANGIIQAADDYAESMLPEPCVDAISRQAAIDALMPIYKSASLRNRNVFSTARKCMAAIEDLPSAQPERTCVNCGRTANNGGWYADGGTRCPIEEHYALPKDGYCHLWEKRNVTDDDYPERREK